MEPKEETDVWLITTRAFNTYAYNFFLKIPSLCLEFAYFHEHKQGGGHSNTNIWIVTSSISHTA